MGSRLQSGVKKKAPEEVPFKMRLKFTLEGIRGEDRGGLPGTSSGTSQRG